MKRQMILGLLAGAALLAAACGKPAASAAGQPPHAGRGAGPGGPIEVGVVTLRAERVVLTTELPGRTAAYLIADVRPQVNGIIQERRFVEGSTVQKGALLYQIDPAPYEAAFEQAKAALAVAEANLPPARSRAERLNELVAVHAVGQQDADEANAALARAEASIASARASVETARINLSYTPLKAPISGRTGRSAVTPGALVSAYQPTPLVTIQQLDPIYVDVTQSSAELLRLRRNLESGQLTHTGRSQSQVRLLLEDGTPYPRQGRLEFRDVTVDPTTGSVVLRMVFPNPDALLLPGMFVRAIVEEGVLEQAILAPQQGVTRDARGNASALVVDEAGTAAVRPLVLGRAIGDRWLVTSGLADGDRIIVDGLQRIQPGMPVQPVAPSPAAGPASGAPGPPHAQAPAAPAPPASGAPGMPPPAAAASGRPAAAGPAK
ncbi:MAG TPA: efflux RND transporter periplasmic adaptor subunit [Vicinamibacterales bacterium]|nr:efflux RND transporter periplasmic adaptor subunit [Vicinamibacterales bacterium]HPK71084.1 efflux RND transporter periplasmic adaptor subunit [Vicinamibacterales bacterium]